MVLIYAADKTKPAYFYKLSFYFMIMICNYIIESSKTLVRVDQEELYDHASRPPLSWLDLSCGASQGGWQGGGEGLA